MDIHPPEHPIRSLRDFVVQIFTVTCGIVIALGLESIVEGRRERTLASHARADFAAELAENRSRIEKLLADEDSLEKWLATLLDAGEAKLHHKPFTIPDTRHTRAFVTLPSAAWDTALATQAVGQLAFAEARALSTAYNRQATLNSLSQTAREQWISVAAYGDFDDMTEDEIRDALRKLRVATAYAYSLAALEHVVVGTCDLAQAAISKSGK